MLARQQQMGEGYRCLGTALKLTILGALILLLACIDIAPAAAARVLQLDPGAGPIRTTVTAVAQGFGDCPVADDVQDPPVRFVTFVWDVDDVIDSVVVAADGSATTTFRIPESASLRAYRVRARCRENTTRSASNVFTVTPPEVVQVPVPNVVGMLRKDAVQKLADAGLKLGKATGNGQRVKSQDPEAGDKVDAGTSVNIDLGTKPPTAVVPNLVTKTLDDAKAILESRGLVLGSISGTGNIVREQTPRPGFKTARGNQVNVTVVPALSVLVIVPKLIGKHVDDVPGILSSRGLTLGPVSGNGDVVRRQDPLPGTRVRRGSVVDVSTRSTAAPIKLVPVPNVVGGTLAAARSALTAAGLVLGDIDEDKRKIATQTPAAGTLAPVGATVSVTFADSPTVVELSKRALILSVILVLALIGALSAYRVVRQRLDRRWIRRHVQVTTAEGRAGGPIIAEYRAGASPENPVVRIESHSDHGSQSLEEV